MTAASEMRDLTHRLLRYEANAGHGAGPTGLTALRVYDKLRCSLLAFVGLAGFHSLASRALTLTRPEAPSLDADGSLQGLGEIETQTDRDGSVSGAVEVLLIVRLLELLRMFLGEALTLSLLRSTWPSEVFDDGNDVDGRES